MEVTLSARSRPLKGKGPARRARAEGFVPAVLYGRGLDALPIAVEAKAMQKALHTEAGGNVLVNLQVEGRRFLAMPREIQRHPIRGTLLHVDFVNVARDVEITADVPVHLVGDAHGVKMGGLIEHHLWEVKVEALPSRIPPAIGVDISALDIGQHLRVEDLPVPEGAQILTPGEEIVASVVEPQVAPAAAEEVEAEVAAPVEPAAQESAE
ncbi:MAG TPA: 50S ribosomal protein L25 [Actinomycetota bacterium]|jgi:large subunit ribosomal protein L25